MCVEVHVQAVESKSPRSIYRGSADVYVLIILGAMSRLIKVNSQAQSRTSAELAAANTRLSVIEPLHVKTLENKTNT